jgi:protein disulfide-isomerase
MLNSMRLLLVATLPFVTAMPLVGAPSAGSSATNETKPVSKVNWFTDYALATKIAQQKDRPIFLLFTGSDWCRWCIKLEEEVFDDPAFVQAVRDKFIFVYIDSPRHKKLPKPIEDSNRVLRDKFDIEGYPTVLILTSQGELIGEAGYVGGKGPGFLKELQRLLPKHLEVQN